MSKKGRGVEDRAGCLLERGRTGAGCREQGWGIKDTGRGVSETGRSVKDGAGCQGQGRLWRRGLTVIVGIHQYGISCERPYPFVIKLILKLLGRGLCPWPLRRTAPGPGR